MEPLEAIFAGEFDDRQEIPFLADLPDPLTLFRSQGTHISIVAALYIIYDNFLRFRQASHEEIIFRSMNGPAQNVNNLTQAAQIFEQFAKLLDEWAGKMRECYDMYSNYLTHYTIKREEVDSCVVCVKGKCEGTGFVVNYKGRFFVVTCAHVVGDRERPEVRSHSGEWISCRAPLLGEPDIAVLPVDHWRSTSVPFPKDRDIGLNSYYLEMRGKVEMWYRLPKREGGCGSRCGSREGSIVGSAGELVRIDVGHVRMGDSGSPLFFHLDQAKNTLALLGMLTGREMERVGAGGQTVGALMVRASHILDVLEKAMEDKHDRSTE